MRSCCIPGPMNRGIEITPEVADGAQSCVLEQVTNGIAVRMALLFLLMAAATRTMHRAADRMRGQRKRRAIGGDRREATEPT